jgi:hypothetical protein
VVLFALLTGERMFQGDDISETPAHVVTKVPDIGRAPVQTRRLLRECLQKDPKQKLRDIGDARRLLEDERAMPMLSAPSHSRLGWVSEPLSSLTFSELRDRPSAESKRIEATYCLVAHSTPNGINSARVDHAAGFLRRKTAQCDPVFSPSTR